MGLLNNKSSSRSHHNIGELEEDMLEALENQARFIKKFKPLVKKAQEYGEWFGSELVDAHKTNDKQDFSDRMDQIMATVFAHIGGKENWFLYQFIMDYIDEIYLLEERKGYKGETAHRAGQMTRVAIISELMNQAKLYQQEQAGK